MFQPFENRFKCVDKQRLTEQQYNLCRPILNLGYDCYQLTVLLDFLKYCLLGQVKSFNLTDSNIGKTLQKFLSIGDLEQQLQTKGVACFHKIMQELVIEFVQGVEKLEARSAYSQTPEQSEDLADAQITELNAHLVNFKHITHLKQIVVQLLAAVYLNGRINSNATKFPQIINLVHLYTKQLPVGSQEFVAQSVQLPLNHQFNRLIVQFCKFGFLSDSGNEFFVQQLQQIPQQLAINLEGVDSLNKQLVLENQQQLRNAQFVPSNVQQFAESVNKTAVVQHLLPYYLNVETAVQVINAARMSRFLRSKDFSNVCNEQFSDISADNVQKGVVQFNLFINQYFLANYF